MVEESKKIKKERLEKNLSTRKVYYFIDAEKNINQRSREVFKNIDKEIHYPFGYYGEPKYNHISKIIYIGFNGTLPKGTSNVNRGLGFTKVLRPFAELIDNNYKVKTIKIVKLGSSSFSTNELILTEKDLNNVHSEFKNNFDKHKSENEFLAKENLYKLFPKKVSTVKKKYIKNSIATAVSTWKQGLSEFSGQDKKAIKDLFDKLSLTKDFFNTESLIKTKENVDSKYIEDIISQYQNLMKQKNFSGPLEKRWHKFLKKHNWIFSYIFSFPIMLFQDHAFVGGKGISNEGGKVTDFLIKNNLTKNVAFIEIKTHRSPLIRGDTPYRGSDVFPMNKDLTGAIAQVLDQRDKFQKSFTNLKHYSNDKDFQSFNSKCVVLSGLISNLGDKKLSSFELFRSNSKDVEIVTFDELFARISNLKELMAGKVNDKKR